MPNNKSIDADITGTTSKILADVIGQANALQDAAEGSSESRQLNALNETLRPSNALHAATGALSPTSEIMNAARGMPTVEIQNLLNNSLLSQLTKLQTALGTLSSTSDTMNAAKGLPSPAFKKFPMAKATARSPSGAGKKIHSVSDIGIAVRNARKAKGFTQAEFADLAGVGRRFMSELESGKPTLEIGKVLIVAAAAGIQLMLVSKIDE